MSVEEKQEKNVMEEARDSLNKLEQRFSTFSQQQFSFINALDNCRQIAFEPSKEIASISQVNHYAEHVSDNLTDKRVLKMFLTLVKDLGEFRRKLIKLSRHYDDKVETIFAKWKKTLEPTQNISQLRVKFPNSHLNHLSVSQSRNHFGGIVSVMPTAMDCAREALDRIDSTRAYRRNQSADSRKSISSSSFGNVYSAQANQYARKKVSPSVSSPVPSNSLSPGSAGQRSFDASKSVRQVRSASPRLSYKNQRDCQRQPAAATQTPKCLGATLKPMLDWQHQTLSEEDIKKTLRLRRTGSARPQWKP